MSKKAKVGIWFIVGLLLLAFVYFPNQKAHALPSVGGSNADSSPSTSITCDPGLTLANSVMIVHLDIVSASSVSFTDSLGDTYSSVASVNEVGSNVPSFNYVVDTHITPATTMTITATYPVGSNMAAIDCTDVQGLASTGISQGPISGMGIFSTGDTYSSSVPSITPTYGSYPMAFETAAFCGGVFSGNDAGTGFPSGSASGTLAAPNCDTATLWNIYTIVGAPTDAWPGGSTTASVTRVSTHSITTGKSAAWVSIVVEFPTKTISQNIKAIATGGAGVQTVSIGTACYPGPQFFSGDSAFHTITAFPGCSMDLTVPSGYVWVSNGLRTISFTTCNSGFCPQEIFNYTLGSSSVTQPITATNLGAGGSQSVGLSGCGTSGSISGDGSPHSVTADPFCNITATLPGGFHWIATSGISTTITTCGSGTCPDSSNTYSPDGSSTVVETLNVTLLEPSAPNVTYTVSGCSIFPGSGNTGASTAFTVTQSCYYTISFPNNSTARYGLVTVTDPHTYYSFESIPSCITSTPCTLSLGHLHLQEHLAINGGYSVNTSIPSDTNDSWFFYKANLTVSSNGINMRPFGTGQRIASWNIDGGSDTTVSTTGTVTTSSIQMSTHRVVNFAYVTQYLLTREITGSSGTITLSPNSTITNDTGWFDIGTNVTITAVPLTDFHFNDWNGTGSISFTGVTNPAVITMNSPITEIADFSIDVVVTTVRTSPLTIINGVQVNGSFITGSFILNETAGTHVNITAIPVALGPSGHLYYFSAWSDAGARSHIITITSNATLYTATFTTGADCPGSTPFQKLTEGCWLPAVVDWYSIPIGPLFFFGIILGDIDMALFIKSRNVIIAMMVFSVGVGVLGYALPAVFSELAYVVFAGSVAGVVYKIWTLRS